MPTYRLGSKGPEVERLQERLKALQHYIGPLDGIFGGGTQSAVKSFQRQNGLSADGIVGPVTWRHLFPDEEIHAPAIHNKPLAYRSLALTGAFETGAGIPDCFAGLSGDFDDQGLSFGVLQWNLGQGSLQPLLKRMDETHSEILREIFDERYPELLAMLRSDRDEQLDWARSMQDQRQRLTEPWLGLFKTLGRWEAFQNIQVEAADRLYQSACVLCTTYGVRSERAVALMFDIKVQNGSISELVKAQIENDFKRLGPFGDRDAEEVARLRIIANRRAEVAKRQWVEDVRARKLAIANGEGTVHGHYYHLEDQYGIRLMPAANL